MIEAADAPSFFMGDDMTSRQPSNSRTPSALSQAWQQRTELVKLELAAASAANDAKTARLRAQRLAKEQEDAAGQSATGAATAPRSAKKARRIVVE